MKLSFTDYLNTVLTPEDAEDVVLSFETEVDSDDDELSAGDAVDGPEEESEDDLDEPVVVDQSQIFVCPPGFKALDKSGDFLAGAELFILMLWKDEGWELDIMTLEVQRVGTWAYLRKDTA
ncbi:hypothetical protein CYMTET_3443 [Cymbomonas tetramitiformis]|uniref:Uncharacterized protein n=1 Tax=Cymbomonas tetramitiformis TaxID=36881 RepID=A0AAE0H370_9CHLO|nr:hypothetical protein CYMTET_3443 [Cymbomonas tetramitiformis]